MLTETNQAGTELLMYCIVMEKLLLFASERHIPAIALLYEARIAKDFPPSVSSRVRGSSTFRARVRISGSIRWKKFDARPSPFCRLWSVGDRKLAISVVGISIAYIVFFFQFDQRPNLRAEVFEVSFF